MFLRDPMRGTAIFGTVGTGFAVLLAFVVLVAFQSYGRAKAGAESEAVAVVELFRTAEFFPAAERDELQGRGAVLRPGRRVGVAADARRRAARRGHVGCAAAGDRRSAAVAQRHRKVRLRALPGAPGRSGGRPARAPVRGRPRDHGADLAHPRARRDRGRPARADLLRLPRALPGAGEPHGGVHDRRGRRPHLVWSLDDPYRDTTGSIRPVEMRRSIAIMHERRPSLVVPCTSGGDPRPS